MEVDFEKKFKVYQELLLKWQRKINLVSNSTLNDLLNRHFIDSAGIFDYLTDKEKSETIVDLGSGAGFPALILAILGCKNIFAIESDKRKCLFMQQVKLAYKLENIRILNSRIESAEKLDVINSNLPAKVITARAFAELKDIFDISSNLRDKNTRFLLLKGQNVENEILKAKKHYTFDYKIHKSNISDTIYILDIKNLKTLKNT